MSLHDFVKKELGETPSNNKTNSNLASVLNILAEKDLNKPDLSTKLNEYNIDQKITFNDLGAIKTSTINDKKSTMALWIVYIKNLIFKEKIRLFLCLTN